MIQGIRRSSRAIIALLLLAPAARGQEAPGREIKPGPPRASKVQVALSDPTLDEDSPPPKVEPPEREFDLSIFQAIQFDKRFGGEKLAPGQIRAHLDGALATKLERAASESGLSPRETAKLRLAGRGDIKRLVDRIDAARSGFEAAKRDPRTITSALAEVDEVATRYQTYPFDRDSLFAKTRSKIVADRGNPPGGVGGPAPSTAP